MRNLIQNNVFCHSLPFLWKYLEDLVIKLPKGTNFWKLYLLPKVEIICPWEFISVSQDDHSAMFCANPGFWEAKARGIRGISPFTGTAGSRGHKGKENGRSIPLGPPLPGSNQVGKSRLRQGPVVRISSAEETTIVDSGLKLADQVCNNYSQMSCVGGLRLSWSLWRKGGLNPIYAVQQTGSKEGRVSGFLKSSGNITCAKAHFRHILGSFRNPSVFVIRLKIYILKSRK